MRNFFRVLPAASFACGAFCAFAGTATYSFSWYRNAAQADVQVPVALEEGVNGFSYADAAADGKDSSTYNAAFVRGGDDATEDGPVGTANVFGTEARKYNCASMQNGQVANLGNKFTISFWLNSANLGKTALGAAVSEYLFVGMVPSGQFAILHGYKVIGPNE